MKRLKQTILILVLSLSAVSCSLNSLEDRAGSLEKQLDIIEAKLVEINNQIIVLNALYKENILISSYTDLDHGYELKLSNGQCVKITYGDQMEGVAPLIAINEDGFWVVSVDGGKTFTEVEDSEGPMPVDGDSPKIGVDEYGFWTLSYDKGLTWERLLNENGDPISATDGKSLIDGSYCFFKKVAYNEETGNIDFTMSNGDKLSIPAKSTPEIEVRYMSGTTYAYAGRETKFPVTLTNVSDAVFTEVPDGWRAKLDADNLSIIAPEDGESGQYTIKMLALSPAGSVKPYSFTFNYDKRRVFRDDFDGEELDLRFWNRHKPSYRVDWNRYTEPDPDFIFLYEGALRLRADKYETTYRTGAAETQGKFAFTPPFRIDCRARFTEMANGVWFAIWACPDKGYNLGEIDIMEKANYGTQTQHSTHTDYTLHTDVNRRDQKNSGTADCLPGVYNVYSVELTDEALVWYINDEEVFRYKHIVHSLDDPEYQQLNEVEKPYYLNNYTHMEQEYSFLVDVALGGAYPGVRVVDSELPGYFDIDWVEIKKI